MHGTALDVAKVTMSYAMCEPTMVMPPPLTCLFSHSSFYLFFVFYAVAVLLLAPVDTKQKETLAANSFFSWFLPHTIPRSGTW